MRSAAASRDPAGCDAAPPADWEGIARVTTLLNILKQQIAETGPLTLARYMTEALGHPKHGYYITRDPLGATGDFITAPEISQMFGELLGLWAADVWQRMMGRPRRVLLVELGPGRGTLLADALRAARKVPGFLEAVEIHLVETSPALRERQRQSLISYDILWHDRLSDVPDGPTLLLANEFFDALPVRQFESTDKGWRERLVGWDAERGRLTHVLAQDFDPASALITFDLGKTRIGDIAEVGPVGIQQASTIAARIVDHGGAALIVDYGYCGPALGDSFQAVRDHKFVDPLEAPGEADLTTHVDFGALIRAAQEMGALGLGPVDQGRFLYRLGIEARLAALLPRATPAQRAALTSGLQRLTDPKAMGSLFKVVGFVSQGQGLPSGFEATDLAPREAGGRADPRQMPAQPPATVTDTGQRR